LVVYREPVTGPDPGDREPATKLATKPIPKPNPNPTLTLP